MNFFNFVKQYTEQVGGQFTTYDTTKSIVVVPVTEGRFQTILLFLKNSSVSGKQHALITSKVCEYIPGINLKDLMEQNARFDYSKFIIDGGYLKIEASVSTESASEDDIKYMIQEVANLADEYEMKLTGRDIH
jgi:hypothetical protein